MARFPVNKPYRITQGFKPSHLGIDIAPGTPGKTGVKIYAPEMSKVVASGDNPKLEGKYLILQGAKHWYYFGHFDSKSVRAGQSVKQGQVIGVMGKTGLATGIHTHHEVRTDRYGGQIDPEKFYKSDTIKDMYKGKTAKQWNQHAIGLHKDRDAWKKKAKALEKKLKDCGDPTSNDQAVKDSMFNKIKKAFGK